MLGVSAVSADDKHCVTVDDKVVDPAIELAWTGLAHKARAAPSLPLASGSAVGGGMAAGAAFVHPRAADARVHPIFLRLR